MIAKQTGWIALVALAATLFAVVDAKAQNQTLGQHPAVLIKLAPPAIDPNTFIVAHPAQLTLRSGHAGYEHPALTARRAATEIAVDPNTFLVQPPATTTWTHEAPAPQLVAATGTR